MHDFIHALMDGMMGQHNLQDFQGLLKTCSGNAYRFYAILRIINARRRADGKEELRITPMMEHCVFKEMHVGLSGPERLAKIEARVAGCVATFVREITEVSKDFPNGRFGTGSFDKEQMRHNFFDSEECASW